MRGKKWFILLASLALVLLASSVGVTRSFLVDLESSTGNTFQAWTSREWVQTTQADFEAGVLSQVDTSSSPGEVKLATLSDWYNTSWAYRKQITFTSDSAKIPSTQSYFPVLIGLSPDSDLAAHAQDDGDDILFTSSDGTTQLDHEIEEFDGGTGELVAWVEVPSLSTGTVIYMYYGHATCGSQQDVEHTWDGGTDTSPANNFKMVQHLQEDPSGTAPQMKDSTSNNNDGTSQGSMTAGDQVIGQIDGSLDFDGSDDFVGLPEPPASSTNISTGSVFAWIKTLNAGTSWRGIVVKQWAYGMYLYNNTFVIFDFTFLINRSTGINLADGNWHFVGFTFQSGISNGTKLYIDGVEELTTTLTVANQNEGMVVGAGDNPGTWQFFSGIIDEVRVSNIARSAEWIKTCYNNQSDPGNFYSMGSEEGQYVSSGTIASQVRDTGVDGARWDGLFWDEILPSNTNITFEVRASDTLSGGFPDASWVPVGGSSPVTSGLPAGRYMQWRATLTTSDTSKTPILQEVRVYHY